MVTAQDGDGPCRSSIKTEAGTISDTRQAASTGIAVQIDGGE
jgi:hypothetical protein